MKRVIFFLLKPENFFYGSVIILTLVIIFIGSLISCSNSDRQIIGKWDMVEYKVNNQDRFGEFSGEWTFYEDGRFVQSFPTSVDKKNIDEALWSINQGNDELILDYMNKKSVVKWKIIRLEDDTLRVEYTIPGFFIEREFAKKQGG